MSAYDAIKQIIEERSKSGIWPFSAPLHQARHLTGLSLDEFREEIRELQSMGVISIYPTINSYSFILI